MAESRLSGFSFSAFQSQLGNVVQNNQFAAYITLPPALAALFPDSDQFARKISFAIRAADVPESTIGEIAIPFRNRKFRIPGDREQGGTWDVTIRYDMSNLCHNILERWSDSISGYVESDSALDGDDVSAFMGVGELHQLTRNNSIVKSWSLSGIWLSRLGALSYDWSSENQIVEIPASFVFQHVETPVTRNNTITEADLLSGQLVFQ